MGSAADRREHDDQVTAHREHVRALNAARHEAEDRLRTESREGDGPLLARAAYRKEMAGIAAEHDVWAATNPQTDAPAAPDWKSAGRQSR